jgi:hypothetical protein
MPSIQDVADQINARLDQINTHTADTAQNTADLLTAAQTIHNDLQTTNNRLSQIDNTLQAGFANLSQGLFALLQVQVAALQILDHQRQQNDTIICELVNVNGQLCVIKRRVGKQVTLLEDSLESTRRIEGIMVRSHCCEAADYDRDLALRHRLDSCCPPDKRPEEPCPEPCKSPQWDDRGGPRPDWRPLPTPHRPEG